jgi:putative tryptophan/tyrosine transport system substrate-binding protein
MVVQARTGALLVGSDFLFNSRIEQVTALAARYAIPTMYSLREFVAAGGLISYGISLIGQYRQVGYFTRLAFSRVKSPSICLSYRPRKSS